MLARNGSYSHQWLQTIDNALPLVGDEVFYLFIYLYACIVKGASSFS